MREEPSNQINMDERVDLILIDDDEEFAAECVESLRSTCRIEHLPAPPSNLKEIRSRAAAAILLDIEMPGEDGIDFLKRLRSDGIDLPVIMLTKRTDIATIVTALKSGASNYVGKEQPFAYLRQVLRTELAHWTAERRGEFDRYLGDLYRGGVSIDGLDGTSPAVQRIHEEVVRLGTRRVDVLITGETGVGKEIVARAIHHASGQPEKPLVTISVPDIPRELFESTLFGHQRGSFTGAISHHLGAFEIVGDGDLFLDEVADIPLDLQAKLLHVLESRSFRRIGLQKEIPFRGRVISATNRRLDQMVQAGEFRADLYHRLKVFPIEIPPLRERPEDILPIAAALLERQAKLLHAPVQGFTPEATDYIQGQDWAGGNARQLRNEIDAALVRCDEELLGIEHLRAAPVSRTGAETPAGSAHATAAPPSDGFLTLPYDAARHAFERSYVEEMLRAAGGVVNEAARRAQMPKESFRRLARRVRNRAGG